MCARISAARDSEIIIRLKHACYFSIDKFRRSERNVHIRLTAIWQNASCSGRSILSSASHSAVARAFILADYSGVITLATRYVVRVSIATSFVQ